MALLTFINIKRSKWIILRLSNGARIFKPKGDLIIHVNVRKQFLTFQTVHPHSAHTVTILSRFLCTKVLLLIINFRRRDSTPTSTRPSWEFRPIIEMKNSSEKKFEFRFSFSVKAYYYSVITWPSWYFSITNPWHTWYIFKFLNDLCLILHNKMGIKWHGLQIHPVYSL